MDFHKEKEMLEKGRAQLLAQLNFVMGQIELLDRLIAEQPPQPNGKDTTEDATHPVS